MSERKTGVVLKGVGGNYDVICGEEILRCRAAGRVRKSGPLVCGDRVSVQPTESGGYILEREPRRNSLVRPAVANIDQLVILCSQAPPVTDPYLIDKVTVIALRQGIRPIILLNKSDLDPSDALFDAYTKAGFPVLRASAATGEGIEALRALLPGKISAFTGNSAIGKSSILNRLDERFALPVGEMSEKIGRGKHTTRHVELLRLENGGIVADTPGFSSFDVDRMELMRKEDLQHCFREFAPYLDRCRFQDCAHVKEQGCAVLEALHQGKLQPTRHQSYVRLYEQAKAIPDWQRNKGQK